jgi:N-acetylglucosamine kinase-like BadF-type ATPase
VYLQITHDGLIALEAAFAGGSGLIVITGTGSSLFGRTHTGRVLRAGGWGYLLGDEGSGHALGLHGLQAVAHAFDGGPPTRLQTLLADQYGLDTPDVLKRSVYREAWPVQQMAPLVIEAAEQGDGVSRDLVATQTEALARQAAWLAEKHPGLIEQRLALLGGLVRSAYYRDALAEALTSSLPGWRTHPPMHPPVVGALRLAMAGLP